VAARRARPSRPAATGQHFLGRRAAASLVGLARIERNDLVFEIGAGAGALTRELAAAGGRVVAVELDPALASRLRRRFASCADVEVVEGDASIVPLPRVPFRAFGNVPFGITTRLLHRLLDQPTSELVRADLVVQQQVARKRTASPPRSLVTLSWAPWWRFEQRARLPAYVFHPRPRTDAALLSVVRRQPPLLDPSSHRSYRQLLERAFRRAGEPVPKALRGVAPSGVIRDAVNGAGLAFRARPVDLTVEDWLAVFERL
jgi:23S rRNA (adenine-N6)-dimethyltransferase